MVLWGILNQGNGKGVSGKKTGKVFWAGGVYCSVEECARRGCQENKKKREGGGTNKKGILKN